MCWFFVMCMLQRKGINLEEYPFAKFNKKESCNRIEIDPEVNQRYKQAAVLKYNEEEYARHLTISDWTKQETDEVLSC